MSPKISFSLCFTLFLIVPPLFGQQSAVIAQPKPISQSVAQPLTLYQPLQHLQWEGDQISKTGIAYFPLEGVSLDSVSESDLDAAHAMQDSHRIAQTLAALGLSRHLQGEYDRAIDYYRQGLKIVKQKSDLTLELMILGNLGLATVQSGNYYAEAIDDLNEYAASAQGHRKIQALGNLANAYFGADLYVNAIALHQKRLALSRKVQDQASEAKTLSDLGIIYQALGEPTKAIKFQEQALALAQKLNNPSLVSFALGNLGIISQSQSDYAKATEYQQKRLALSRQKDLRGEAEALANLGGIAYFQGDYQGAIDLYSQAWNIAWNTLHDADILYRIRSNQGLVYAQMGDPDKALDAYGQYFQYASSRSNRQEEGIAKINAAASRLQSGNPVEATKTLREAIDTWETLRSRLGSNDGFKISIFETQNAPYSNLQSVLVAQNQPDAALEISERGRARAFAELLARRLSALSPQKEPSRSPFASPTIAQIKQIAQSHRATLVEYSIIPANFNVKGKLETHESELLIWVVQPTGSVALRRVDLKPLWQCQDTQSCQAKQLADLASVSRTTLRVRGGGNASPESAENPLRQLHELLIQPIADLLPQDPNAQVILIPHRALLLVPFVALQDAQGKFLIEQHTISIAPSIQVLDLTAQLRKRLRTSLKGQTDQQATSMIIGNPTMPKVVTEAGEPPEQLPPLPGSEKEATTIAQLLKSSALIGKAAKKSSVLQGMSHSRLIHLATHGLMSDFSGLGVPGAIALAPDAIATGTPSLEENGLLTASEIFDLKLNAELVVLSACNTGRGKLTGDGVVGLSRALIAARVPSIMVSLWSVPDEPTALLMTEFYRNLQRQPDKAQALRQAMLTTMKQHPAPLDWAGFILIGETN